MPTKQEINITKLGIIAGGGGLPQKLLRACIDSHITPYIVGFDGQTDKDLLAPHNHKWFSLGQAGKIMQYFKDNDVHDLVMTGSIKRPSFATLKTDLKGLQIISKIGLRAMGDDGLLSILKAELESEGFTLRGIQNFCASILMPEGVLGSIEPPKEDQETIALGIKVTQALGALDIGQSAIVQQGIVIGVEAAEGTDELIKRCKPLLKSGRAGVLVKTCKPQQDKYLDLPTIGLKTLENAHNANLSGIVLHAQNVLLSDIDEIKARANKYGIFILGCQI